MRDVVGWEQPGKSRSCWDLRLEVDGHRYLDRYYAQGMVQAAKVALELGYRQGLAFDPATKRFLEPSNQPTEAPAPTVFTETVAWWRVHWAVFEPKSRKETLRYICRPITELLRPDAGPTPAGINGYLSWQLLPPKPPEAPMPEEYKMAASWLSASSLPVGDADVVVWQAYADRWRVNSRTGKLLAQSSLTRHLTDIKQLWAWVCAVHQLSNPWQIVETGTRSSAGGRSGTTVRPVDRTIVLSPDHVRELARLCGQGRSGRRPSRTSSCWASPAVSRGDRCRGTR